jgi:hypothetical protein
MAKGIGRMPMSDKEPSIIFRPQMLNKRLCRVYPASLRRARLIRTRALRYSCDGSSERVHVMDDAGPTLERPKNKVRVLRRRTRNTR